MAVTIKKIAELAGVSAGTVDRALNNRKGVNEEVAKRIRQIAQSVDYVPNSAARGLVARRREVKFGVIIHTPKNDFIGELLAGIEAAGRSKEDYGVEIRIVYGEEYSVDSQLAMIDGLVKEGVSGLAIIPLHDRRIAGRLKELKENGIFVVLMVSDMDIESLVYVGCDLYRNGRVLGGLANMLCQPGARLLYCTPPLGIWGNIRRLQGFQAALADQKCVPSVTVCELQNHDIMAYRDLSRHLAECKDVDAIIITTACTQGVISAIADWPPGKNVKLIALDLSEPVKKALDGRRIQAVVDQHPYLQGKRAIDVLFHDVVLGQAPVSDKIYIDTDIKITESIF